MCNNFVLSESERTKRLQMTCSAFANSVIMEPGGCWQHLKSLLAHHSEILSEDICCINRTTVRQFQTPFLPLFQVYAPVRIHLTDIASVKCPAPTTTAFDTHSIRVLSFNGRAKTSKFSLVYSASFNSISCMKRFCPGQKFWKKIKKISVDALKWKPTLVKMYFQSFGNFKRAALEMI